MVTCTLLRTFRLLVGAFLRQLGHVCVQSLLAGVRYVYGVSAHVSVAFVEDKAVGHVTITHRNVFLIVH